LFYKFPNRKTRIHHKQFGYAPSIPLI